MNNELTYEDVRRANDRLIACLDLGDLLRSINEEDEEVECD